MILTNPIFYMLSLTIMVGKRTKKLWRKRKGKTKKTYMKIQYKYIEFYGGSTLLQIHVDPI